MEKQKKYIENGITLISLTITIIILLILASIVTYSGMSSVKSSKFTKFKTELEIMQAQVDLLYEKYSTLSDEEKESYSIGKELNNSEEENQAFAGAEETDKSGYRYFNIETLKELEINGVESEFLVNVPDRKVISLEGFEYEGTKYYTLEQITGKAQIETGIERNGVTFIVNTEDLMNGTWRVTLTDIKFSKYVGKGIIQYQNVEEGKWKTIEKYSNGKDYTFEISGEGTYIIKITDAANEIGEQEIKLETLGNYLVDGTTYAQTLSEAVDIVPNDSTIKILRDMTETEITTISKNIILDTNGKTLNCDNVLITVENDAKLDIKGNGTIERMNDEGSTISNRGTLEIADAIIICHTSNSTMGAINNEGLLIINSGIIKGDGNAVFNHGTTTINGGTIIGTVHNHLGALTINDGEIEKVRLNGDSETIINGGKITGTISIVDDCTLTIGDINQPVNTTVPEISKIELSPLVPYALLQINFYNGVIKESNVSAVAIDNLGYLIRPGYKIQQTYNSTTGYYEDAILVQ